MTEENIEQEVEDRFKDSPSNMQRLFATLSLQHSRADHDCALGK